MYILHFRRYFKEFAFSKDVSYNIIYYIPIYKEVFSFTVQRFIIFLLRTLFIYLLLFFLPIHSYHLNAQKRYDKKYINKKDSYFVQI